MQKNYCYYTFFDYDFYGYDNLNEFYTINTSSIRYAEGHEIGTITEYLLSPDGALIKEYSCSIDYNTNEIVQEIGKSLNDTPAELDWKRLSEY